MNYVYLSLCFVLKLSISLFILAGTYSLSFDYIHMFGTSISSCVFFISSFDKPLENKSLIDLRLLQDKEPSVVTRDSRKRVYKHSHMFSRSLYCASYSNWVCVEQRFERCYWLVIGTWRMIPLINAYLWPFDKYSIIIW